MTEIRPFDTLDARLRMKAADILMRALAHVPSAYHTVEEATAEVAKLDQNDRLGFAALDGTVLLGFVGAIRTYSHGWELHPLVVDPDHHRHGIGTLLIRALEERARKEGALTLYLGTDDDYGGTTLSGRELYPDPTDALRTIAPVGRGHPFFFYRKVGFVPVGVLPDVNGKGKPDLFMAKRLA
jgi:aminoglycoside 6'-N-acetyltransferase I